MISGKKVIDEIIESNIHLFNSFLPKFNYNFNLKNVGNLKKFRTIIIIGMGGSILGTKAIYSFLKHKIKKNFFFQDNLSERNILELDSKNLVNQHIFLYLNLEILSKPSQI